MPRGDGSGTAPRCPLLPPPYGAGADGGPESGLSAGLRRASEDPPKVGDLCAVGFGVTPVRGDAGPTLPPGVGPHRLANNLLREAERMVKTGDRDSSGAGVTRWGGLLRALYFGGAAGAEDYEAAGLAVWPPPQTVAPRVAADASLPDMSIEALKERHPQGYGGSGAVIQLTLTTTFKALGRGPRRWECELMNANVGHPEWSVGAVILFFSALEPDVVDWLVEEARVHLIPLATWPECLRDWFTALRRCPRLRGMPHVSPSAVLELRKMLNCVLRSNDEADWKHEYTRKCAEQAIHTGVGANGMLSQAVWYNDLAVSIKEYVDGTINATVEAREPETASEFWRLRWERGAAGSSSERKRLADLCAADERLGGQARANKKAVLEAMTDADFETMWEGLPSYVARGSTKPEPGGKQRALYATTDECFILSAYGSADLEKYMNIEGIRAKQTPADVVEWVKQGMDMAPQARWVSLDYSDYNWEHTTAALMLMELCFAAAWCRKGGDREWGADKTAAALWSMWAHAAKFTVVPKVDASWRFFGGLFTGCRNTARDNTLLHGAYSKTIEKYLGMVDPGKYLMHKNYTGDDEDSVLPDWVAAANYLVLHSLAGFAIKPAKQMCSRETHEFLMRLAMPAVLPTRPLGTALAIFTSGNWYKDVHVYYDSIISGVSSNVWELVARGLPLVVGRRLAAATLNAQMRLKNADGTRTLLEWWRYRHGTGAAEHPLWAGTPGDWEPVPEVVSPLEVHPDAPTHATNAWVKEKQRSLGLPATKEWDVVRKTAVAASFGKMYSRHAAHMHEAEVRRVWPRRESHPHGLDVPGPPKPDQDELKNLMYVYPIDRRPTTEPEVFGRIGLTPAIVAAFGGIKRVLLYLPVNRLAKYVEPAPPQGLRLELYWEDSAIQHWHRTAGLSGEKAPRLADAVYARRWPRLQRSEATRDTTTRVLILAPNGAGKTTYCRSHQWVFDSDEMLGKVVEKSSFRALRYRPDVERPSHVASAVEHILLRRDRYGIATQLDVDLVSLMPSQRGWEWQIYIVQPPRAELETRLRARGWDDTKIARRLDHWEASVRHGVRKSKHLTSKEREGAHWCSEWPEKI
ncbi:hypothetical protein 2 [Beihai barnacle virus 15]|uniref:hypothetical protein 2 n=1 Tax=Beihai barnacle virus 15 TaxID=1922359 RepID=UPI000909D073|nr:hypothetical protein 2 [Beihai barnacle virus 15]APG75989.1 hypothetical protein 2 [Beihai barnacle virus 15]